MPSKETGYSIAPQYSLEIDGDGAVVSSATNGDDYAEEAFHLDGDDENDGIFVNGEGGRSKNGEAPWSPSGDAWKDFWYFSGPGWLLSM